MEPLCLLFRGHCNQSIVLLVYTVLGVVRRDRDIYVKKMFKTTRSINVAWLLVIPKS